MGRRLRSEDLYAIAVPTAPALSPDGTRVVYALCTSDRDADESHSSLWVVDRDKPHPIRLTDDEHDTAPAWSPDGSTIAFLRTGNGPAQVWLLSPAGGDARRISTLPLGAGRPVWSPDGTRIAVTAPTGGQSDPEAPIVLDRLGHKADGVGMLLGRHRHLHIVDIATGVARQATDGDWDAGDPAWSPEGTRLAFAAAIGPDADLRLGSAAYVIDVDDPGPPRLAGADTGVAGPLCWLPSGDALLVVGRRNVEAGNASLLRVPLTGGEVSDLTAAHDRNVMPGAPAYPGGPPALTADGSAVLVCVRDRGCTHLWRLDLCTGERTALIAGASQVVSGLSVAGGRAAVVVADGTSFGEVAVLDESGAELQMLTNHTGDALPGVELISPEPREFRATDGTPVHGWLIRAPGASAPAPLVLDVHGGPHNAWNPAADAMHLYHQVLAASGVSVLLLNPRGSDGYGEKFLTGAIGRWGLADDSDLLGPVEQLVAEGAADPDRLGVCGYSYGGYMACHLTTRTDRFTAAVAGGVVTDLVSMIGTSDEGHLLARQEWTPLAHDGAEVLRAQSPIESVDRVSTPTLILHGLADLTCPVGQAEQWFTALRQRGVTAQLVLYPGAPHVFVVQGRPSHRADYNVRLVEWLSRHFGAAQRQGHPRHDTQWQRRLASLAAEHRVPGATLGILRYRNGQPDEVLEYAYGVLNTDTGVSTTTDSVFQLGSITKTWTASVVMQLVDEGLLELDAPVIEVLPELRLRDDGLTKQVTMRDLLAHTSGIDGDIFDDTGRGDDCLQKYVAQLDTAAVSHPIGATFSYCNTGYVIAGRVIEVLTGMTWDRAMRERLFAPLGLSHTCTLPEQALAYRAAVGHVTEHGELTRAASPWGLPRSIGPAGLICSTVHDVLRFARLHLTGGLASDGTRLLSASSTALMQEHQTDLPDSYTLGDSWGLGWIRYGWDGHRLLGHDGATIGQAGYLRVLPEQGLAICLLTNGGQSQDLYRDLFGEIVAEIAGIHMPAPIEPPARPWPVDARRYIGTYERTAARTEIIDRGGKLVLRAITTGPLAELLDEPSHEYELIAVADDLFAIRGPGAQTWNAVTFYRLPDGTRFVHYEGRASPKVS